MKNLFKLFVIFIILLSSNACKEETSTPNPLKIGDCRLEKAVEKISFLESAQNLIWVEDRLMGWYDENGESVNFYYNGELLDRVVGMDGGSIVVQVLYEGTEMNRINILSKSGKIMWYYKLEMINGKLAQVSYCEDDNGTEVIYSISEIIWKGENIDKMIYKESDYGDGNYYYTVDISSTRYDNHPNPASFIPTVLSVIDATEDSYDLMKNLSNNNLLRGAIQYNEDGYIESDNFEMSIEYNVENWPIKVVEEGGYIETTYTYSCE